MAMVSGMGLGHLWASDGLIVTVSESILWVFVHHVTLVHNTHRVDDWYRRRCIPGCTGSSEFRDHYIEMLERGRAAERADSIRSVSEVEEVVCVCEGNRGYLRR